MCTAHSHYIVNGSCLCGTYKDGKRTELDKGDWIPGWGWSSHFTEEQLEVIRQKKQAGE